MSETTSTTPDQERHQPTRRAFLLMCAAVVVPWQRTIQVREPYWTVNTDAVCQLPQRIFYTGVYKWKHSYVTASGETLATWKGDGDEQTV